MKDKTEFVPVPEQESSEGAQHRLVLECSCHCHFTEFERWEWADHPDDWELEIGTNYKRSWRERLQCIWLILRGKDYYFESAMHQREQFEKLYEWLGKELNS